MASGPEAKFSIPFETNAPEVSRDAAAALEQLRQKIQASQASARDMSASMSKLRGSTEEVKKAKEELKAKIEAERNAISTANLQLLKAGTSYDKLTASAKQAAQAEEVAAKAAKAEADAAKAAAEAKAKEAAATTKAATATQKAVDPTKNAGAALKAMGGPVGALPERFENLKRSLSGAGGGMGVVTLAAAGLVLAITAVVAAVVAGTAAFAKWIFEGANAARTLQLTREGFLGSADAAKGFTSQIDALARKVPTSKEELGKLGQELAEAGLRGDEFVDSLNAVAQTASAKGAKAGDELKKKLIDSMGAGAKEARLAAEKEFGALNTRKMLDLNVQADRFKENLSGLTSGVNLEPLLQALSSILSMFDQSTTSGQAMKEVVTAIGNGFVKIATEAAPIVKQFMRGLILGALDAGIAFFKLHRIFREAFGDSKSMGGIDTMKVALTLGKVAVDSLAIGVLAAFTAWRLFTASVDAAAAPFVKLGQVVATVVNYIKAGDWAGLGKLIIDGLVAGLTAGGTAVASAVKGLADKVKSVFTGKDGIDAHSPSQLFKKYGKFTTEGYAEGVSDDAGGAAAATTEMIAGPPGGGSSGVGGATVNLNINVGGGGGGTESKGGGASKLADPGFQAQLLKAVEDFLVGQGIPVAT